MTARTTILCAVWHGDPDRAALLEGHRANLDRLDRKVERVYVFDGDDHPPEGLPGRVAISREPLTIYEAWNLGLTLVRTALVMNLNLDDRLAPDALGLLESAIERGADLAGGDWRICHSQAETDAVVPSFPASELPPVASWPPPSGVARLGSSGERGTRGPACLWRMSLHERLARYPWQFADRSPIRVIGDSVFWAVLEEMGRRLVRVPSVIGNYHSHPSAQAEFRHSVLAEQETLRAQKIALV